MARVSAQTRLETRDRLLEAAARHFAEHGLEPASVDSIAVSAGCAKGTLYNYFASKEELFAEVVSEACRRAVERFRAVPDRESLREQLVALAAADVLVLREQEGFTKVLVREALGFRPATYALIVEHLSAYVGCVETLLRKGVMDGEIRGDRPSGQLALLFVGMLSLLFVQHWGSDGAWPTLDEIPELVVSMFLDGAAVRPQTTTRAP
ncbi:MAG: TetR/AcrR family transcriptional regulator [Myxococcota bacterium]